MSREGSATAVGSTADHTRFREPGPCRSHSGSRKPGCFETGRAGCALSAGVVRRVGAKWRPTAIIVVTRRSTGKVACRLPRPPGLRDRMPFHALPGQNGTGNFAPPEKSHRARAGRAKTPAIFATCHSQGAFPPIPMELISHARNASGSLARDGGFTTHCELPSKECPQERFFCPSPRTSVSRVRGATTACVVQGKETLRYEVHSYHRCVGRSARAGQLCPGRLRPAGWVWGIEVLRLRPDLSALVLPADDRPAVPPERLQLPADLCQADVL